MLGGIEIGLERFALGTREITEQEIERVAGVGERDDKGKQRVYLRTDQGEILWILADRFDQDRVLGKKVNVSYDRDPAGEIEMTLAYIQKGIEAVELGVATKEEKAMWEKKMRQEKELIKT